MSSRIKNEPEGAWNWYTPPWRCRHRLFAVINCTLFLLFLFFDTIRPLKMLKRGYTNYHRQIKLISSIWNYEAPIIKQSIEVVTFFLGIHKSEYNINISSKSQSDRTKNTKVIQVNALITNVRYEQQPAGRVSCCRARPTVVLPTSFFIFLFFFFLSSLLFARLLIANCIASSRRSWLIYLKVLPANDCQGRNEVLGEVFELSLFWFSVDIYCEICSVQYFKDTFRRVA